MYVIENRINSSGTYKTKKGYFSLMPFESVKVKEKPLAMTSGLKCYETIEEVKPSQEETKPSQEEVQKNVNKSDSHSDKH